MPGPFYDHELEVLDRCAAEAGSCGSLLRVLVEEPARTRSTGRVALRQAIEVHIERAATQLGEFESGPAGEAAQGD
jgi:hypothetical protein